MTRSFLRARPSGRLLPAADRLRVPTSTGTSLRINVEDGKTIVDGSLEHAEADANKGKTPKVTAGAYSTACRHQEANLYDFDTGNKATCARHRPVTAS